MLLNRDRAINAMDKRSLDALVASTETNLQYLTDVPGLLTGYAVLPREKNFDPFLVTGIFSADKVITSGTWVKDVRYRGGTYYYEYDPSAELTDLEKKMKAATDSAIMDVIDARPWVRTQAMTGELVKGLQERGLDKGNLGIEESGTTITQFREFKKMLPKVKFMFADDAFAYTKQVKTADHVKLYEESVPIVDEGIKAVFGIAKPGVTDGELVKEFRKTVGSYGPEGAASKYNFHLSIGRKNIISGTGIDRSTRLEKGDLITIHGNIIYKNHYTSHARTAVLGEPKNPKVNSYYKAILDAEEAGLQALRPGISASDIYDVMIETAKKTIPHYRRHMMGHAVGLGGYDTPSFMADDHTLLEEGMVFNIEPVYVEFGLGGLRLEDTLVITKSGYKLFTTTSRDLWRL